MLTLQIKEKEIENLTPEEEFVRGTVGAKCQINFDEFWQGYEKYIVFKRVGYEPINIMVNSLENEIEIPYTILAESGEFKIGVFGTTETETLPTLYSKDIKILYGTDTHGTTPPTYIPSEIDQLRLSKQDKLVSGENIKTVNGESVLGSGNIEIQVEVDQTYSSTSENAQSGTAVAEAIKQNVHTTNISEIKITLDNMTDFSDETVYVASKDILVQYAVKPSEETEDTGIINVSHLGIIIDHNFNSADVLIKKGSIIKFSKVSASGNKRLTIHAFGSIVKSRASVGLNPIAEIYQNYIGSFINANAYIDSSTGSLIMENYVAYNQVALFNNAYYNLVNGESPYSLRTSGSKYETPAYKLGQYAFAEGNNTMASSDSQHVQGKYNIEDNKGKYAHIIGNGSLDESSLPNEEKRSNAHTVDWQGNAWYAGDVYVGSTSGTNKDEGSKKLATEEYADTQITEKTDQTYNPDSSNAQSGKAVDEALSGYVMAEVGKGLSSNDFTNEDKEKLYSALQNENIDKTYNPTSENAQSGKAVAEAIAQNTYTKISKIEISVDDFSQFDTSKVYIAANDIQVKYKKTSTAEFTTIDESTIYKNSLITFSSWIDTKYSTPEFLIIVSGRIISDNFVYCNAKYQFEDEVEGERFLAYEPLYFNPSPTDLRYFATSDNPQSGKAVAEAVSAEQNRADNVFSNSLKGSKSGSSILIDDVSPVTHEMSVKISSDTVTDLMAVKVSRCGKNLFTFQNRYQTHFGAYINTTKRDFKTNPNAYYFKLSSGNYYVINTDGFRIINNNSVTMTTTDHYGLGVNFKVRPNETYTVSYKELNDERCQVNAAYYDENGNWLSQEKDIRTFTIPENCYWMVLCFVAHVSDGSTEPINITFSNIQLELGTTATEYEPYITPTEYTPDADGTVNGVTSLYPNTTLMTDTDGVLINCEYNRDINKAFAELQQAIISLGGNV